MIQEKKYLIIGGSTKCGTTSLFNYFEFHPGICASVMKESRYFWDNSYPIGHRKQEHIPSFDSLFRNCSDHAIRMEATPDYLYSAGSAKKIRNELQSVKFVFIFREPVDRLRSWYKFSIQHNLLPPGMSFDGYITAQKDGIYKDAQAFRALEQGKYSEFLKYYISVFGKENILVLFYEDLSGNPVEVCRKLCHFTGIDASYFNNYEFKVYNKSIRAKSMVMHKLFTRFKRSVGTATKSMPPSLRKKLKLAGHGLEKTYASINSGNSTPVTVAEKETLDFLEEYYNGEAETLFRLTGEKAPWNT